jgi:starch synthase
MLVVHIASELSPIAKVGGLGDVVYGLSKELIKQGHQVQIVLPKYCCLQLDILSDVTCFLKKSFYLKEESPFEVLFWKANYQDLSLILVDPQSPQSIFQREGIYGQPDDIDRFLLFCFLAIDYVCTNISSPSLLHLHDWPAAFVACLYKELYAKTKPHKTILTIHNVLHQGRCSPHHLYRFGLEKNSFLQDPYHPELINLLKSGIIYADRVVAVSPNYANEIKTKDFGYHLDSTLLSHSEKLSGILNGIDLTYWNPQNDNALVEQYPPSVDVPAILKAKSRNKSYLQQCFHLNHSSAPLFGCVTRLDYQKGPDLIAHAITTILEQGGQCIVLGIAMDPKIQEQFNNIKHRYANNPNFHFHDQFNEPLARLIYASSDFILIPSLFEPCGLTQMIGMRYYTVPIVRTTGGLADTVHDIEDPSIAEDKKVGICFKEINVKSLDNALNKAFSLYQNKIHLMKILKNLSMQDFSWKESAKKYLKIYEN